MAAGTKYFLDNTNTSDELYRVESGVRKSGPWKITDITNLAIGYQIPAFAPVEVDLKTHEVTLVRNVKVVEAYTTGVAALTIKIAKNSLAYSGMFIGSGTKGAQVSSIDSSNGSYDVLTIAAAFGENIAVGAILFEATAVGGLVKKNTANFVVYDHFKKIEDGGVFVTLLQQAYEIKESKLALPIHSLDKVGLTSRFQFDA